MSAETLDEELIVNLVKASMAMVRDANAPAVELLQRIAEVDDAKAAIRKAFRTAADRREAAVSAQPVAEEVTEALDFFDGFAAGLKGRVAQIMAAQIRNRVEILRKHYRGPTGGEVTGWRPIEEAPYGSDVLVYDGELVGEAYCWMNGVGGRGWAWMNGETCHPTHFRELPPAPLSRHTMEPK